MRELEPRSHKVESFPRVAQATKHLPIFLCSTCTLHRPTIMRALISRGGFGAHDPANMWDTQ